MTTPQAPEKIYISENGANVLRKPPYFESACCAEKQFPTDIEYTRSDLVESKPLPRMSLQEVKDLIAQQEYGFQNWNLFVGHIETPRERILKAMDKAAELYAQQQQGSKWEKGEELLREALLQIEYLHSKFKETGTGNAVIEQIKAFLPQQ